MSAADVEEWSLKIHGHCDRHDWVMSRLATLLHGDEPDPKGYSRNHGVGESRIDTMRRLLAQAPACPGCGQRQGSGSIHRNGGCNTDVDGYESVAWCGRCGWDRTKQ